MLMTEFIDQVIEEVRKPDPAKNALKSVAATVFGNLLTLPFGLASASFYRTKSKEELRREWNEGLFSPFRTGWFEDRPSKERKNRERAEYSAFLDSLPPPLKLQVLLLMLKFPAEYKKFAESHEWRSGQKSA